jgi:branched-chain amino acid transport system substrate-binding protein
VDNSNAGQHRNKTVKAVIAAVVSLSFAATACTSGGNDESAEYSIGIISPMTGAFGEIGQNIRDGVRIAIDQVNARGGVAGGHQIRIEAKDEGHGPETAIQAARQLVSDGVQLLGGVFSTADCAAIAPLIETSPAVFVASSCAGNELTGAFSGESPFTRSFGVAVRDRSNAAALADLLAQRKPTVTQYSVFGFDYNWGRDTWKVFQETLEEDGVSLTAGGRQWVPLSTSDFRSQVSSINRGLQGPREAQGIFLSTFGAGTAGFLQQAKALDLSGNVDVLANAGEYYNVARSLKGGAPQVWNAYDYNWAAFDNELNDAFVSDYGRLRDGAKPVGWTYQGYLVGLTYAAAFDKAESTDTEKVLAALRSGLSFDSPSGKLTMGAQSHQLDLPSIISLTVGSPQEPDGVRVIETAVAPYDGK